MIHLLDANVLLSLGDANHPHHTVALRFLEKVAIPSGWATCPLTENAFVRILGRARPNCPGLTTQEARLSLRSIIVNPGHQFWPDELSLTDSTAFPKLPPARDLTDLYLLALARQRRGLLATFDLGMPAHFLQGGQRHLHVISTS